MQADPNDMLCHYGLGVCLSALGRLEEAAGSLQTALELKRDDVMTMSALASVLHTTGNPANISRAKVLYTYVSMC